jgi:serine/threonine protein phosphatase PrpC
MSVNDFKPKQKINKIFIKKNNVRLFDKNQPKMVDNKQIYLLPHAYTPSVQNREAYGHTIRNKAQSQNKINLVKKIHENANITNRCKSPLIQSLIPQKPNRYNSHYNIFTVQNSNVFRDKADILGNDKGKLGKDNNIDEGPKNNLRNHLKKNNFVDYNSQIGINSERLANLPNERKTANEIKPINGKKDLNINLNINNYMTINYDNSQESNHTINYDDEDFLNKIFNNNPSNNRPVYTNTTTNNPSIEDIINELIDNNKKGENTNNNKLMNKNPNSQYTNFRATIAPGNNDDLNDLLNYNYDGFVNPLTNQNNNNYNLNNILNNSSFQKSNRNDLINPQLNDYLNNISKNNLFNVNSYNNLLRKIKNESNSNSILKDFGFLSVAGSEEGGSKKINQDSYISKTNINGLKDFNIFGVLDGHGIHGHFISELISEYIPEQIINNFEIKYDKDYESIYNKLINNNYQIIKDAFTTADYKLKNLYFDADESGTTCILLIQIGYHLISANVGDSRAIVVFDDENDPNLNFLNVIPLSTDFKPELPGEKDRIMMYGGVVDQLKNKFGMRIGPYRVFARGKDYPGLAMSRSLGDFIGKKLGIIAEPGVVEYYIGSNTKFFVLGSDGVWEFLSNDKVKEVGKQFYLNSNAKEFCQEIVSRSVIEWRTNEICSDDITVLAGFF